jgi:hypothetical protein
LYHISEKWKFFIKRYNILFEYNSFQTYVNKFNYVSIVLIISNSFIYIKICRKIKFEFLRNKLDN